MNSIFLHAVFTLILSYYRLVLSLFFPKTSLILTDFINKNSEILDKILDVFFVIHDALYVQFSLCPPVKVIHNPLHDAAAYNLQDAFHF